MPRSSGNHALRIDCVERVRYYFNKISLFFYTRCSRSKWIAGLVLRWNSQSLDASGKDKTEFFPGAKRYLPHSHLTSFKAKMRLHSPLIDAVDLALLVLWNAETALMLFFGEHCGLNAALKQNILFDLLCKGRKLPEWLFRLTVTIQGSAVGRVTSCLRTKG